MAERLDIEGLRALVAISTHGGVTRAAEHLALSQPAVSHKIKRLETVLDCELLARRAGGPLFTEAGTRLLEYAHRMMDLHDEALAALGKKPLAGTIKLGMTEDTTGGDVARILGRFTRLHHKLTGAGVSRTLRYTMNLMNMARDDRFPTLLRQFLSANKRHSRNLVGPNCPGQENRSGCHHTTRQTRRANVCL
ncbi:LysR family transcriptional regulator [Ruegeria sp. HKCCA5763]|uniref:LysR family transcriptional regulator n=1 Tax=Ruegeria sp. HKCCA5763 TaxID=2682987 RepID=UPI001C2BC9BB|nr:LysR family transcriptional regulator [Ruegeria sp. HKCCA5763]